MNASAEQRNDAAERPVFVIGHKNPDTDSVCAALAYAALKHRVTGGSYIAARCGHLNEETQYVLHRFDVQPPLYIKDVRTQVRDMEMRFLSGDSEDLSLKKAGAAMREAGVVTLCITKEGKLAGLITTGDIVEAYMDVENDRVLSEAHTPYRNITETLDGEMVVGDPAGCMESGKVVIAAGNPEMLEEVIERGDLVILGNRYDTQLCAIEMEAGCIVVCDGAKISSSIQKRAGEHGCHVISTPHDTFTVARLINQSLPVRAIMKSDGLVSFRMDDFIEDIEPVMTQMRHRYFPVLDKNDNFVGMISRRNFLGARKKQLILVDHNEMSQAVQGLEDAEIMEIIDHHRLGTVTTLSPVFFRNQPLGSSSTIIYQMYRETGTEIDAKTAGLLLAAILSDTLLYRSPTCTAIDKAAGEELARIAGIDAEQFAREMFRAGSHMEEKTADEILRQDFKRFSIGESAIGIGQINSMDAEELADIRSRVLPALTKKRTEEGLQMIFFLLTDIIRETSEVLFDGKDAAWIVEHAFSCPIGDDGQSALLPGIVSRKKQFLPAVVEVMQS
ncbi:MAG: putative manganese-dependent inorganic diphosphatase [Lachnospiraceae bacterium]|nr:putative manganese-dependent inorganic diphosphatase [Lachnospiraceae bacterium]